jgi:hypothetical protein
MSLLVLVALAVTPRVVHAGPIAYRITPGPVVVDPGHRHLSQRLQLLFDSPREFSFEDTASPFPAVPLYRLDPAPVTPPDSLDRVRLMDGQNQAIDLASFRLSLEFTDLASGQSSTINYVGTVGSNWIQNRQGKWILLEDYAVVNQSSVPLTLGGNSYTTSLLQRSPRESDLVVALAPSPTPEPGTLALAGTGLLIAVGVIRRRKR